MDTSRISSGFDVELQLGGGWFFTALNLMNENGLLTDDGTQVTIENVSISFLQNADLQIDVAEIPFPILVRAAISEDGSELIITSDFPQLPEKRIPFGALNNLEGNPVLVKREGEADHEPAIIILANLKIQAGDQSEDPIEDGEEVPPRGNADDAQSFLPSGKNVAFGIGRDTYQRFANNIWHTNLRAEDGSHPLPDEENKKGSWKSVSMKGESGKLVITLKGEVPIDIWPDADVTITLTLTPQLNDGKLGFSIESDTNVDTGILGDLFAGLTGGLAGGLIGLLVGVLTGGILVAVLVGAAIGFVVGVIALEIVEVVVEGIVQKIIKAKIDGEDVGEIHCNEDGIVQLAMPPSEGFNLSVLDSIPTSISIHNENPEDEFLYKRSLLVTSIYDDFTADSNGFAVCGMSGTGESFQPEIVSIVGANYEGEVLKSLTYETESGDTQELEMEEIFLRASGGELKAPFKLFEQPDDSDLRIPTGKLACPVLKPVRINRDDTIVKEIEFENGIRLLVPDTIALQDAAAIIVAGYQLIHPRDYNAYYRAKADFFKDNNFESLPEYA